MRRVMDAQASSLSLTCLLPRYSQSATSRTWASLATQSCLYSRAFTVVPFGFKVGPSLYYQFNHHCLLVIFSIGTATSGWTMLPWDMTSLVLISTGPVCGVTSGKSLKSARRVNSSDPGAPAPSIQWLYPRPCKCGQWTKQDLGHHRLFQPLHLDIC